MLVFLFPTCLLVEGDKIDEFDVADVLLQIMGDEFEVP